MPIARILTIIKHYEVAINEMKDERESLKIADKEFTAYLKFGISFLNGVGIYYEMSDSKIKKNDYWFDIS
ncbi:hypothetical protein GCM10022422_01870 [Flavobacterium ginsengisoli]|uniref:Uncharacterized protein n=1 Tax=Flavobacterium ginsengisoli TaxID=871694 RepID=A0ABP7EYU8_9FLAO|nr:hypothetical protein [Flavobacterium ginsengisoli]